MNTEAVFTMPVLLLCLFADRSVENKSPIRTDAQSHVYYYGKI